jgi:hypothetical protein
MAAPPCFKVKVEVLMIAGSIAPLKVMVSLLSIGTPVAALTGIVELTATG